MELDLISIITQVGFPIAMCVYLLYAQKESAKQHTQEVDKLRETVENNTKVMIKICTKLGVDVDD